MSLIDVPEAWRLLLAIRRHPECRAGEPADGVCITPSGEWTSRRPVQAQARQLLDLLLPLVHDPARPCVVAQLGQSLDGRIATPSGKSHYISGPESRVHLHRLRALADAVIVGAGTVMHDNPRLTVRHVPGPHPVRVILDPRGRVAWTQRVFHDDAAPTWHAVRAGRPSAPGAVRIALPDVSNDALPGALIRQLRQRGVRTILVEGGGITLSHFMRADCIDRLHLIVAPMLIGCGAPALNLKPIDGLDQALAPACRWYRLGDDQLFELDLRSPRRNTH